MNVGPELEAVLGDTTEQRVDAVVNAASTSAQSVWFVCFDRRTLAVYECALGQTS